MNRIIVACLLVVAMTPVAWPQDPATVRALAEQGEVEAQFILGSMYRDGQGVAQDYDEALRWWREAAGKGSLDAQFALGNIYAGGLGIAPDYILAYMWYDIASMQSGADWLREIAGSNRDALTGRMTPDDISEARRRVADWQTRRSG